jgi:hypothetical protein
MELGKPDFPLPNYVCISALSGNGTPVGSKSGFLGPNHSPLCIRDATLGVEILKATGDLEARHCLLDRLEHGFHERRQSPTGLAHLSTLQRTRRMMQSKEAEAYDIGREPKASRAAYGKSRFGESCLLARRLIEVGVPFVEIAVGSFDNHGGCGQHKKLLPAVDAGLATLVTDLLERGLLDSTLIVFMGEFGRGGTNLYSGDGENRGHWNKAWSTLLIGGGIAGGQIIGKTDKGAVNIEDRPVTIEDFFATICSILGIDYSKENTDPNGRPIRIVAKGERPLLEILPGRRQS